MNRHLALTVPLQDRETPASFAARLARRNGTTPRNFCTDLGLRWPDICSGHADQVAFLATLGGADRAALLRWSAPPGRDGRYQIGQTAGTGWTLRRSASRVCPDCIAEAVNTEGPYGVFQRFDWLLPGLAHCPHHRTPILRLPNAGHAHETYDIVAQVERHRRLIEAAAGKARMAENAWSESYLLQRILGGSQSDWLEGLDLTELQRAALTLGTAVGLGPERSLASLSIVEQLDATEVGLRILRDGPQNLRNALSDLHGRGPAKVLSFASDLGAFYRWLNQSRDRPALAKIAATVEAYIRDSYPDGDIATVLGSSPDAVDRLSIARLRARTGRGAPRIKRLYQHHVGKVEGDTRAIPVTELAEVVSLSEALLGQRAVAKRLAIYTEQVGDLAAIGVLPPLRFDTSRSHYHAREVEALEGRLEALPYGEASDKHVPVAVFCRRHRMKLATVISTWRNGSLHGICRAEGSEGLQQLLIPADAIIARSEVLRQGDLPVREAARHLRISNAAVRKLRDSGYLVEITKPNPKSNRPHRCISEDSLDAFCGQFRTLGQIAADQGVAPMHLARRFDRNGIAPLDPRDPNLRVYSRAALARMKQ